MLNPELDSNTFSYGLIGLIAAFVVGRQGITQADIDAWTAELRADSQAQPYFFSLNRYLFSAAKPVPAKRPVRAAESTATVTRDCWQALTH